MAACFEYWKKRFDSGMKDATDSVVTMECDAGTIRNVINAAYFNSAFGLSSIKSMLYLEHSCILNSCWLAMEWLANDSVKERLFSSLSFATDTPLSEIVEFMCDDSVERRWMERKTGYDRLREAFKKAVLRELAKKSTDPLSALFALAYQFGRDDLQQKIDDENKGSDEEEEEHKCPDCGVVHHP
jgi:hypothetical protein